jgi:hypothetical protein
MEYVKGLGRLAHLYHLRHDGMDVGYTVDEIVALAEELGWNAEVEAQYPVPETPAGEQTVDVSSEEVSGES